MKDEQLCIELKDPSQVSVREALDYFLHKHNMTVRELARNISYPEHKLIRIYNGEWQVRNDFAHKISYFTYKSRNWWLNLKADDKRPLTSKS